ncbi:hypothetical protein MRS44_018331 [Fusarium solani]|uniref:uncharacterized protein n=1 Tax=Fusarium solani TaxID=169388 RepID=UPI0032C48A4B|nr:hypothetical protein MRS44_018331 [Fusarium solani]
MWSLIVRIYASTLLTKSADKLIALSGIAKRFAALMNDTYIVGMWHKKLASQLLWYVGDHSQSDGSPSLRPQPYRAPSFSWASVDGMVYPAALTDADLLIDVTNIHLDYVTDDTTGLVKGGYLDLKGRMRPFEMVVKYTDTLRQLFMQVDGVIVKDSQKPYWQSGPLIMLDVNQETFDVENKAGMLYYMPAKKGQNPADFATYLLFSSVDDKIGTFRRIGISSTPEAEEIEMLNGAISCMDREIPCLDYADGLHTIRII